MAYFLISLLVFVTKEAINIMKAAFPFLILRKYA